MAFIAIEVVALPVLLYLGHDRWFQHDEWDFLASREATSLHDLFAPHDVHWTTLPVLVYRGLWSVFGIGSYVPYQTASVLVHLVVAALIRVVMRRAGVGPWTATAAATLLVFFGSGEENITWAFQITFTGAIAFGLADLLLADHDGPVDRRDWLGLLAGLCALLCSGAAVAMVLVVGLAVLLRRGWMTALLHTLPLATVYVAWYVAIGKDADANRHTGSLVETARFVGTAVAETFGGLAAVKLLGWLLGAFLVAGLVLAWKSLPREELRSVAAAPAALLVGAFAFLLMTGVGRVETGLDYLSGATRLRLHRGRAVAARYRRRGRRVHPSVATGGGAVGPCLLAFADRQRSGIHPRGRVRPVSGRLSHVLSVDTPLTDHARHAS